MKNNKIKNNFFYCEKLAAKFEEFGGSLGINNFNKKNWQNILIIDTSYEKDSIFKDEFCMPIANIIKLIPNCKYEIKHFSEKINYKQYDKIIIAGSSLKDFEYLNHLNKFEFIKTTNTPILGICAGIQIIAKIYGAKLKKCKEIEITKTITTKQNKLFEDEFDTYSIHNYSINCPKEFEIIAKSKKAIHGVKHKKKEIYGVLFHPEIKNKEIIEKFINL